MTKQQQIIKSMFSFFQYIDKDTIQCSYCNHKQANKNYKVGDRVFCDKCLEMNVFCKNQTYKAHGLFLDENDCGYWFNITYKKGLYNSNFKKVYKIIDGKIYTRFLNISMGKLYFDNYTDNGDRDPSKWRITFPSMQHGWLPTHVYGNTQFKPRVEDYYTNQYINYQTSYKFNLKKRRVQNSDPLVIEHLIKRMGKYYLYLYIDEDYNVLENFNKHDLRWLKNNNLTTEELEVFKEHKWQNHSRIKNYIIKTRQQKQQEQLNKLNYDYLHYKNDTIIVKPILNVVELKHEGKVLQHCVGGYVGDIIKKNCIILALRDIKKPQEPKYTIEVKSGKIRQFRGLKNCSPPKEVKLQLKKYCERKKIKYEIN